MKDLMNKIKRMIIQKPYNNKVNKNMNKMIKMMQTLLDKFKE